MSPTPNESKGKRPKRRDPDGRRSTPMISDHEPASVIYGVLPVVEALRAANRRIDKILITEGARENRLNNIFDLCRERSISWSRVPADLFARYVDAGANHQGVLAIVAAGRYLNVDEILGSAAFPQLLLILDGVEDPRNLGAILRVAECSGVDGIVIPERRAVGLTDTVAKSSAGAIEHVKVAKTPNLNRLIINLKKENIWVVGTSGDAELSYTEWDWTRPCALVLGGEGQGLHRLVAENCDILVRIPMYGKINSLNVSVAAGVVLFEARRQREGDK